MNHFEKTAATASRPSWILFFALVLAAIGVARQNQQPDSNADDVITQSIPVTGMGGTADSNNRMIAVTGIDVTGSSILYLVDTETMRLAVYQANGGSASTQGVKLVGARRIDLDMLLDGLNDESEYTYKELRDEFERQGILPPDPSER